MSQTKEPKDSPKDNKGGKPRVYNVAADLGVDTKTVLEYCKDLGFTQITSQLKALEPDQIDALRDRHKNGKKVGVKPAAPVKPAVLPKVEAKVPTLAAPPKPRPARPETPEKPAEPAEVAPAAEAPAPEAPEAAPEVVAEAPKPAAPVPAKPAPLPLPKLPTKLPNLGKPPTLAPPKPKPAAPVEAAAPAKPPVVEAPAQPAAAPARPAEVATPAAAAPVEPAQPAAAALPPPPPAPAVVSPPATPSVAKPDSFQPAAASKPATFLPPATPVVRNLGVPPRPLPSSGGNAPQHLPPRNLPPRPAAPAPSAAPQPSGSGRTPPNPGPPSGRTPPNPGPPRTPGAAPRFGPQGAIVPPGQRPSGGPATGPASIGPRPPAAAGGANSPPPRGGTMKLTLEQIQRLRELERQKGRVNINEVQRLTTPVDPTNPAAPGGPAAPVNRFGPSAPSRDGGGDDRRPGGPPGPGGAAGRDQRQRARQGQARGRAPGAGSFRNSVVIGKGGSVDMIENARHRKKHRGHSHAKQNKTVISGKVDIETPVTVRNLSTTIGMKVGELILKLKNVTNSLYTMNSNVEFDVAEMIAIDKGIELVAKTAETAEDEVLRKLRETAEASDSENTTLRPPVVTIMGHVDHGKTSLLDRIRAEYGLESDVVSTEAGGITQVLRAWRVEKDGKSTTFLDTPGHEAFTKMRARGANVTDIAVIVVSATDGIMPQTQEAVAHAQAADVDIIVAINKCDLPGAQPDKVKARLFDMNLVPEDLGGDVPVIYTSAMTGQGIGELLDSIALLAELGDLKADPTLAGSGTCLEAYREENRGVVATLLVQNGTIRKGDVILCGSTYGRVRAMYDDLAQPITEAGPSTPIKLIGLNDVPDADDPFYVVDDVATAREIAGTRGDLRQEADRVKFSPVSLDKLKEQSGRAKVSELKVILKAEARGSVEAIKKELEKLTHEEVRVRVLHAGIGAINESDVTLALTSPADTIIVGFNVTSDDAALKIAENRGVKVQEYQIIYNLVDDIRAALEGRLKPIEEVVHLGRAVVRDTFKITKVGTIAGCYVTSGVVERSARVRVIRDGVVMYPQGDKVVGLESLKRFKDDAKEVREGFECGLRISGFDDVKTGDVIEAFKIEIKTRTL